VWVKRAWTDHGAQCSRIGGSGRPISACPRVSCQLAIGASFLLRPPDPCGLLDARTDGCGMPRPTGACLDHKQAVCFPTFRGGTTGGGHNQQQSMIGASLLLVCVFCVSDEPEGSFSSSPGVFMERSRVMTSDDAQEGVRDICTFHASLQFHYHEMTLGTTLHFPFPTRHDTNGIDRSSSRARRRPHGEEGLDPCTGTAAALPSAAA
jgi:hypothetical protein